MLYRPLRLVYLLNALLAFPPKPSTSNKKGNLPTYIVPVKCIAISSIDSLVFAKIYLKMLERCSTPSVV